MWREIFQAKYVKARPTVADASILRLTTTSTPRHIQALGLGLVAYPGNVLYAPFLRSSRLDLLRQ